MSGTSPPIRSLLSGRIANGIRDRVFSGDLRPGDRVGEMEVAREFGASQAPVREAFAKLREDGLLVSIPNTGTFVSEVSQDEARVAYDLRRLVEPYVICRAIELMGHDDLAGFRGAVEEMQEAAQHADYAAFVAADLRFHGTFYSLAASPLISAMWVRIEGVVRKFSALTDRQLYGETRLSELVEMHRTLLDGVERRDSAALGQEIVRQIDLLWAQLDSPGGGGQSTP